MTKDFCFVKFLKYIRISETQIVRISFSTKYYLMKFFILTKRNITDTMIFDACHRANK